MLSAQGGWRVLATNPISASARTAIERFATLVISPDPSAESIRKSSEGADIIIVRTRVPEDIFASSKRLIGAVRHGVGLDFIPVEAATASGVLVANVPGANANAVAEYCVMQILNLLRQPAHAERLLRRDGWQKARGAAPKGRELSGRSVGIVGFGAIGSRIAHILHFGFQARVAVCTRRNDALPEWIRLMSIADLMAESDVVIPCVALNEDTRRLISSELIDRLRPTAYLVNASRGGVINESALLVALDAGRLAGAALDVFDRPNVEPEDEVLHTPNLLATPHIAGNSVEAHDRIGIQCAAEALRILKGEAPENFVNPEAWGRYQQRRAALALG